MFEYPFQPGDKCIIEQYKLLIEGEDASAWNEWRAQNPDTEVWLVGAYLYGAKLAKADLRRGNLRGANLIQAKLQDAELQGANLRGAVMGAARLRGASLDGAALQGTDFTHAVLAGTLLFGARAQGARLIYANLSGARVYDATFRGAILSGADLKGAYLGGAHLQGADLQHAELQGSDFNTANLQGADFRFALVDGETCLARCEVDRATDFTGVGLDAPLAEPGLKGLLKYNVRRYAWRRWYSRHLLLGWPVRLFWMLSDYGRSSVRILAAFVGFALLFACLFHSCPQMLVLDDRPGGEVRDFHHALYFSVVTMTTLGFGDISANPDSTAGQYILMIEVILGYILLGAIITRLSILFTAEGPMVHFQPIGKNRRQRACQLGRLLVKRFRRAISREHEKPSWDRFFHALRRPRRFDICFPVDWYLTA